MRTAITFGFLVVGSFLAAAPALAQSWSKGFVVDWYHTPGWQDGEKDANCPTGSSQTPDWSKVLAQPWRSKEQLESMTGPGKFGYGLPLGNRGPEPGQNVYRDPTIVPDPDYVLSISGNTGYGFDLDGDKKTGFVSPDGRESGLDNNVYRAFGCHEALYRGGGRDTGHERAAETYDVTEMRGGVYTVIIHLSGEGADPRNDKNARVGIYLSREKIVLDANGEVSPNYSYRVDPDPRFMTVFDAVSSNGVFKPKRPLDVIRIRDYQSRAKYAPDVTYEKPQIDLTLDDEGRLHTRLGGYQDWRYMYESIGAGGATNEVSTGSLLPKYWYNLERFADWKPPGVDGPNTHISSFVIMDAVPAYLYPPEGEKVMTRAEWFKGESYAAREPMENFLGRMRNIGGDPNFRLEGGAATWPHKPEPGVSVAFDGLSWAERALDVRGGLATRGVVAPMKAASTQTPPRRASPQSGAGE